MNPELQKLQVLQQLGSIMMSYVNDRNKTLTRYTKEIADLKANIEVLKRNNEFWTNLTNSVLEERKATRNLCMRALDIAISNGDREIATIAINVIGKDYSKDIISVLKEGHVKSI